MTRHERGQLGEDFAARQLADAGYDILQRNYRIRGGEIDIIARGHGYIVFAEVKLRTENAMVSGLDAVDIAKMRRIYKTAVKWLLEHPCDDQPRFDVMEITEKSDGFTLTHIENAFGAEVCDEIF